MMVIVAFVSFQVELKHYRQKTSEQTKHHNRKMSMAIDRISVLHKLLAVVFLLLLCGNVLGDEGSGHVEDDAPLPSGIDLDEMIAYLRHDDKRLIRYNVPR